jgi:PH (Pleckstrin Homology) domain-containing protein
VSAEPGIGPDALVVRPRRARIIAWICAVVVAVLFTAIALVLRNSPTGVFFRLADQVAMVVMGLLIAGGVLLAARPRVRADARGIEVRNVASTTYVPWSLVRGVAFPDGASFARLDLPADEYMAVLAIQAVDGRHAVEAIRRVRRLHAEAAPLVSE